MSDMKAIILKNDDTFYESLVFANEYEFEKNNNRLIKSVYRYVINDKGKIVRINEDIINKHKHKMRVVLIRSVRSKEKTPYTIKIKSEGYKFFLQNKNEINKIKSNKSNEKKFLSKCVELNKRELEFYKKIDYNYIKDKNDIEDLLTFTGWFCDGCIKKVTWNKNKTKLSLELTGLQSFKKFWLDFEGNINVVIDKEEQNELWSTFSNMFFDKNNQICFSTAQDIKTKKYFKNNLVNRIYADKLSFRYKFASVKKFLNEK